VPDEFRWGWQLQRNNCGPGRNWCWVPEQDPDARMVLKFCDDLRENYWIYSTRLDRLLHGEDDIKADPYFDTLYTTCPALGEPHLVQIPWIMNFQIDRTTCVHTPEGESPTLVDSFGTAFAYASYFEFIVTIVVIQSLLMCGCIKAVSDRA